MRETRAANLGRGLDLPSASRPTLSLAAQPELRSVAGGMEGGGWAHPWGRVSWRPSQRLGSAWYLALPFNCSGCSPERRTHCPSGAPKQDKGKTHDGAARVHTQSLPLPLLKLLPREREDAGGSRLGALGLRGLSAF